jgi:hypothetical protein
MRRISRRDLGVTLLAIGLRGARAVERRLVAAHDRRVADESWREAGR